MMQMNAVRTRNHGDSSAKRWGLLGPLVWCSLVLAACGSGGEARVAQSGDTVSVHYTGTLDDGTQFDSSVGGDPLTFTIGSGQLIAGFDTAVLGMEIGESRTVRLAPEEAYGEHSAERVLQVPGGWPAGVAGTDARRRLGDH